MKYEEIAPRLAFADALASMSSATLNTSPALVELALRAMQVAETQRLTDAVLLVADSIHATALITAGDGCLEPSLAGIEPALESIARVIQDAACRSRFSRGKRGD